MKIMEKIILLQKNAKEKVLKNSLSFFDCLTTSKNEITTNRIQNDYNEKK